MNAIHMSRRPADFDKKIPIVGKRKNQSSRCCSLESLSSRAGTERAKVFCSTESTQSNRISNRREEWRKDDIEFSLLFL